jgi:hypothetical protein
MKTEFEVRSRAQQVVLEEFDRRVELASARLPHLCSHNYRHPLDTRQRVEGEVNPNYNRINQVHLPILQTIGLCLLEENNLTICEDPIDAQRCPLFTPVTTKDSVRDTFLSQLNDADWVKANLPELASLLWVLEDLQGISLPWWKRVWFWLKRVKVEPVSTYIDPSHLLPPSEV